MTSKRQVAIIIKKRKDIRNMDEQVYERLGRELAKCRIREEAEDVLLELAEKISETGIMEKEVSVTEKYNRVVVEAFGTCYPDEDAAEETSVFIRLLKVGKAQFVIDDYLL